ncbi:YczE/YyaS/YitT family protein [Saccharothrix sp. Mg75]|uniref:YczE/YyaS/YitT family protein n=1 Tax=Saccharothrix sp. Mg75 TaxID=3445357 RepID=UPI003EE9C4A9
MTDRVLTGCGARLFLLVTGTVSMGVGIALLVRAKLGLLPLDVLHTAISRHTGWTMGGAFLAVQAVLLLVYLPLRMRPGAGTVIAATVPAVVCDTVLALLPEPVLGWRVVLLPVGGAVFAAGIALYLGAGMGALPRDGLMLELHRRRPWMRPAVIRVVADTGCLLAGWLALGPVTAVVDGTVGFGSLLLAGVLGPGIAALLRRTSRSATTPAPCDAGGSLHASPPPEPLTEPRRRTGTDPAGRNRSRPGRTRRSGMPGGDLTHHLKR